MTRAQRRRRSSGSKHRCPFDGKVIMSQQHAATIVYRDEQMDWYTCEAGYVHVTRRREA